MKIGGVGTITYTNRGTMRAHYTIIATKAGFAVQNVITMAIVAIYDNRAQAVKVCTNLNAPFVKKVA